MDITARGMAALFCRNNRQHALRLTDAGEFCYPPSMLRFLICILSIAGYTAAEEGMWTFNNFPRQAVERKYGFSPSPQWLDRVRLSSVRLAQGCSASFVSPNGLIMTNHHCAASCIQALSTREQDYLSAGFQAKGREQEIRCPNLEANQLSEITDVTSRIAASVKGLTDQAANDARKAEIARIEKACTSGDDVRCEVVTLYSGGEYNLYKYRRYQDVRLVFAPEMGIAFFGGDPDNFMFPRYNLDMTFLRAYASGKPAPTDHYFTWSRAGAKEGELTFVTGHPGSTDRQHTVAMLEFERDVILPDMLLYLAEYRGYLTQFQTRGTEQKRISQDELLSVENSLKAFRGQHGALLSTAFFNQKRLAESEFQRKIMADAKLKSEYGSLWSDIEKVTGKQRQHRTPYIHIERQRGLRSRLYSQALRLVRMAEEAGKPNEKRLEEYAEARIPELRQAVLSPAPVYKEFDIEMFTFALTRLREALGPDDAAVKQILGKRSPREIATELIGETKLADPAVRKALFEGGKRAVDASTDSMILFAKKVDPIARQIRKRYEDEFESPDKRLGEKLGQAVFAALGKSVYPDATFTLRLSFGTVKGWEESGRRISPFTIFGGLYERHTGSDPFALPKSWLDARDKVDLQTPMNFVTTNDIIGGNSGSPMIDREARIVGLIFDGNIHSLGGNYGFDETVNRAVAVHSSAILEALEKVYRAADLLGELRGAN